MTNITPFTGTSRTITDENSEIQNNNFLSRLINRSDSTMTTTLEEVIDINQDLEIYTNHQLTLMNPKTLYKTGIFNFNTQLLRINREEEVFATNNAKHITLVSTETNRKILQSKKKLAHLGLIVLGIKGLTRKKLGTKVLICIIDDRWSDMKKALISAIEVDMSNNKGIFYCNPDFLISTEDLKYIKIGIQSKGYDEFYGRSNILMNLGFLGRLTDNSTTKFKVNTEKIVETMKSKSIEMIRPMEIDPTILAGLEWDLKGMLGEHPSMVPQEGTMYKNTDNSYSLRFSNYMNRNTNEDEEEQSLINRHIENV